VAVIGLSVLTLAQINSRTAGMNNDSAEAAELAISAVELAQLKLSTNANWRTTYTNGVTTTPLALGHGTVSFQLVDPTDGDLANNTTDSVKIIGIGKVRNATRACSVVCGVYSPAITALAVAIEGGSGVSVNSATISGSGTLATNGIISGAGNLGTMNLEAAGAIVGAFATTGSQTSGAAARTNPDVSSVFSYYTTNGQAVSASSIPTVNGAKTIDKALFSPNNNPYGGGSAKNAQGIYVINMNGANLVISNSRIVGTLVIQSAGTVTVSGSNIFEPSAPGYPVLLVQGNVTLSGSTTALSESTIGVNMNPAGTPYPYNGGAGGASNTTTTDTYPSGISGIVYASGALSTGFGSNNTVNGVLLSGGATTIYGTLTLNYDSTYNSNPAPGFAGAPQVGINIGTWQWEQAP